MKFEIKQGTEVIESTAGLVLAGKILSGLDSELARLDGVVIPGLGRNCHWAMAFKMLYARL